MTSYLLLCKNDGSEQDDWTEWRTEEAANAEAAIRAGYLKHGTTDIIAVVAVPSRNWNPQPIRTETTTRLVLGPVSPQTTEDPSDPSPGGAEDE